MIHILSINLLNHIRIMLKFAGKKLLFLGSNVGTIDMIKYAKENGAYTIVADYLPVDKSTGKKYSDGNVTISTNDFNGLVDYINAEGVSGVIAGVSEFNILNAMKICNHFGFPFYCTIEQWEQVEDKELFRQLCIKYSVPTPETIYVGGEIPSEINSIIQYPVIVKPVDGSSSIGITICRDNSSLFSAVKEAIQKSSIGRYIIEELVEGEEFAAHYTIAEGKATLSSVDNRVPVAVHEGDVTTIPVARVYPSYFINEYIEQVNSQMIQLCQSLGLNTGVLFIQGIYNKQKNRFYIFEAGLRCAGEAPYRIIERVNGINFMNNIVDYALLGYAHDFDSSKDNPYLQNKICCVTSFVSKGGRINKILNFEEVTQSLKTIVDSECRYQEGDETPNGNTLRQIVLRFVLICDSVEQLIADVNFINSNVKVLDDNGNDMCATFDAYSFFNKLKR